MRPAHQPPSAAAAATTAAAAAVLLWWGHTARPSGPLCGRWSCGGGGSAPQRSASTTPTRPDGCGSICARVCERAGARAGVRALRRLWPRVQLYLAALQPRAMLRGSLPPLPSKDVCRSPRSPSRRSKGKGRNCGGKGAGHAAALPCGPRLSRAQHRARSCWQSPDKP